MSSTWDWQIFLQDRGDGITYLQWLMSAWGWTVTVGVLAFVVAMIFGSFVGILRTTPSRILSTIGNTWTELFRNIPLLVQIFLWYHVMPALFAPFQKLPSVVLVIFALGFFTSARISEQVRAGIEALPKGQRYAGLAMGFSLPQTYRFVLLPMAFRMVIPPLTSEAMNVIKNSSAAFTVVAVELAFFYQQAAEETSKPVMMFAMAVVCYVLTTFIVNRIMLVIESRVQIPGMLMGGKR